MSARPAAAGRNGRKGWSETGISGGSDALRLVLRTQPRSEKLLGGMNSALLLPRTSVQTPLLQALQDRVLFFFRRHGRLTCLNRPCPKATQSKNDLTE